jgi:hypothetical protein
MDIVTCQESVSSGYSCPYSIAISFNEMSHLLSAQHADPVVRVAATT